MEIRGLRTRVLPTWLHLVAWTRLRNVANFSSLSRVLRPVSAERKSEKLRALGARDHGRHLQFPSTRVRSRCTGTGANCKRMRTTPTWRFDKSRRRVLGLCWKLGWGCLVVASLSDRVASEHALRLLGGETQPGVELGVIQLNAKLAAENERLRLALVEVTKERDNLAIALQRREDGAPRSTAMVAEGAAATRAVETGPVSADEHRQYYSSSSSGGRNSDRRTLQDGQLATAKHCDVEVTLVTCATTAAMAPFSTTGPGNHLTIRCPPGCSADALGLTDHDISGHVVGGSDGLYKDSSPICLATAHATGNLHGGGQFIITIRSPQDSFVGSEVSGVLGTDESLGGWRSFSIEPDPCLGFINVCDSTTRSNVVSNAEGVVGTGVSGGTGAFYENDQHCRTTLVAPRDMVIELTFQRFDTEPGRDTVRVYDGRNETFLLLEIDGFVVPEDSVKSSSNAMYITFDSDASVTWSGWSASWEFVQMRAEDTEAMQHSEVDSSSDDEFAAAAGTMAVAAVQLACPWTPVDFRWPALENATLVSPSHKGGQALREITLPFDFVYFDYQVLAGHIILVHCNGYVELAESTHPSDIAPHVRSQGIPSTDAPNGIIAPHWMDSDSISHCEIVTASKDGELFIEWRVSVAAQPLRYRTVLSPSGLISFFWRDALASVQSSVGAESIDGQAGVELASQTVQFIVNRSAVSMSTNSTVISRLKPVEVSNRCETEQAQDTNTDSVSEASPTMSVDGYYTMEAGMCVSACAASHGYPWWTVDLLEPHFVHRIEITSLAISIEQSVVAVSDLPSFRAGTECSAIVQGSSAWRFDSSCSVVGRYVSIYSLDATSRLQLCEVDVLGDTHGQCGHKEAHAHTTGSACATTGGVVPEGTPCHFPFLYEGETYNECTMVDNDGIAWCKTTRTEDTWGNCDCEHCGAEHCVHKTSYDDVSFSELYIGCYTDSNDDPDMTAFSTQLGLDASPLRCNAICESNGHRYFGLENRETCYCANSYGRHGLATSGAECRYSCSAAPDLRCGGPTQLSVYETSLATHEWFISAVPDLIDIIEHGTCQQRNKWHVETHCDIENWSHQQNSACVQYRDNDWLRMCPSATRTCATDALGNDSPLPHSRAIRCGRWDPFPGQQLDACSQTDANVTFTGTIRINLADTYMLTKDVDSEIYTRRTNDATWDAFQFSWMPAPTTSTFRFDRISTSGDAPPGTLDLSGPFIYAIDVGGHGVRVGQTQFTPEQDTDGVYISADETFVDTTTFRQDGFSTFGGTSPTREDRALGQLLNTARWSAFPHSIDLHIGNLMEGRRYSLQMLFAESVDACVDCDRVFDLVVNGIPEVVGYTPRVCTSGGRQLDSSAAAAIRYEFTASDNAINVALSPTASPDRVYMGCFSDVQNNRDLNAGPYDFRDTLDPAVCEERCSDYLYFGLQWGRQCFCGNTYGQYGSSDQCAMPCEGDPYQACGGGLANSVYALSAVHSDSRQANDAERTKDPILNALTLKEISNWDYEFVQAEVPIAAGSYIDVQLRTQRLASFKRTTSPHLSWVATGAQTSSLLPGQFWDSIPQNDKCVSASDISDSVNTAGGEVQFSTQSATLDPVNARCTESQAAFKEVHSSPSVWFTFTPAGSSLECYSISTCGSAEWDTLMELYDITGVSLATACDRLNSTFSPTSIVQCNDDAVGCGQQSRIQETITQGRTYLLKVGGGTERAAGVGRLKVDIGCSGCTLYDMDANTAHSVGVRDNTLESTMCGPADNGWRGTWNLPADESCTYWDFVCQINSVSGSCLLSGFPANTCPRSCDYGDCASRASTNSSDAHALREAMAVLSQGGAGASFNSWQTDSDPCRDKWKTIGCDHSTPLRRVNTLVMAQMSLNTVFPSSLLQLSNLTLLSMSNSEMFGELPNSFGVSLSRLRYLSLADNQFSGTLPQSLGLLGEMQYLDIHGNDFRGWPIDGTKMLSLSTLDLSMNVLSGTIPLSYADALQLEKLRLSGNAISGTIPRQLGNFPVLTALELYENCLSGTIPQDIANVTTLVTFDVHDNKLEGALPSLTKLVNLKHMVVNIGQLSGTFPQGEFILRLHMLEVLDLGDNDLSGTLPKEIGRLGSLLHLLADDNELKGTIPETIGQLTRLEALNLDRNFIRGVLPESMTKIAGLKRLQLQHNQLSGNEALTIGNVLAQMHSLTTLDLYFSSQEEDLSKTVVEPALPIQCWVGVDCSMTLITHTRDSDRVAHGGLTLSVRRAGSENATQSRAVDNRDGSYTINIPTDWVTREETLGIELLSNNVVFQPSERVVVCPTHQDPTIDDGSTVPDVAPPGSGKSDFGCSKHYDAADDSVAHHVTSYSIGVVNNGYTGHGYVVVSRLHDRIDWMLTSCEEADYTVFIRYSIAAGEHTCIFAVDGIPVEDVTFERTGKFETWRRQAVTTRLVGSSTITLQSMDLRASMMYVDGIEVSPANFVPGILEERWYNIVPVLGQTIDGFKASDDRYPDFPSYRGEVTASFEAPRNTGNWHATRMRAIFWAHETGNYSFALTADDIGEVWVGELGVQDIPSELERAAWLSDWCLAGDWYQVSGCTTRNCQHGPNIHLLEDTMYYIEAVGLQSVGGDNLQVGVHTPSQDLLPVPVVNSLFVDPGFVQDAGCHFTKELKYHDSSVNVQPIRCPFQHAHASQDGSKCDCDAGFVPDDRSNVRQCIQCDGITYSEAGDPMCKPCPATMEPNAEHSGCRCTLGHYSLSTGNRCHACLLDAFCPGGEIGRAPMFPLPGSWISNAALESNNVTEKDVYICNPPEACLGFDASTLDCHLLDGIAGTGANCCRPYHRGAVCGECERDYIKHHGLCVSCPATNALLALGALLFYFCIGLGLTIKTRTVKNATGSIAILTGCMQTISLYGKADQQWILQWVFLDTQAVGNQCIFRMDFFLDFCMRTIYIPLALLTCVCCVSWVMTKLEDGGRLETPEKSKLISIVSMAVPRSRRSSFSPGLADGRDEGTMATDRQLQSESRHRAQLRWRTAVAGVTKKIMFRRQLVRAAIEVLAFCFMPASQRALSALYLFCVPVDGVMYLNVDFSVRCDTSSYYITFAVACCVILFWTLGLPIGIIVSSLKTTQSGAEPPRMSSAYGRLTRLQSIFRSDRGYWYAWLLLRRIMLSTIVLIGQVSSETETAEEWNTVSFFVLTCSVLLQEWLQPFRLPLDNLLEQCTLILMMTVLYIDLASPDGDDVSSIVFILLVVIFACVAIRVVGPKWWQKLQKVPCFQRSSGALHKVSGGVAATATEGGIYDNDRLSAALLEERQQEENVLHLSSLRWASGGSAGEGDT